MLTGDVEAHWKAGAISTNHARQLWRVMPETSQIIVERGPDMINTLVDGPMLLSRITAARAPFISDWIKNLRIQVNKPNVRPNLDSQTNLFEQFTRVLAVLSQVYPILLIIDDCQWMDKASAALLFHLGRRLSGRSILIACAYSPDEISNNQGISDVSNGGLRPLGKLLRELKGRFQNNSIDLAQSDISEGRAFVDNYLDSESNQLDQNFREKLFNREAGHPLFTIELLSNMQTEKILVKGSDLSWRLVKEPDWESLPVRVETVIAQRIDRINKELKDILAIASVEGEIFSAQVIAEVQGMHELEVIRLLAGTLQKDYRLVLGNKEIRLGNYFISQYRFAHALYCDYIYQTLSPGERRHLHHRVGTCLEKYYQDHPEQIAVQLTAHFAGDPEKERYYSRLAGDRAGSNFANEQAIYHYQRALELTPEENYPERFELLMSLEKLHDLMGNRETQIQVLITLKDVANCMSEPHQQATVALHLAAHHWSTGDYSTAIQECQHAMHFLKICPNLGLEAETLRRWALSIAHMGENINARNMFNRALRKAQKAGNQWLTAEILRHLGNCYITQEDPQSALQYFEKSLPILQEIGDHTDQIRILHSMAMNNFELFEYQKAKDQWEEALKLSQKIGSAFYENVMQYSYASIFETCGAYETASEQYQAALQMSLTVGNRSIEARSYASLGLINHFLNENLDAIKYLENAQQVARDTQDRFIEAYILTALGNVYLALNQSSKAADNFKASIKLHHSMQQECAALEPIAGLAQLFLEENDLIQAVKHVEDILRYLETGNLPSTEQPLQIYLRCYQVLTADSDPRANTIIATAYKLLIEWAKRIEDQQLRSSYIKNVPANHAIITAWQTVFYSSETI